MNQRIWVASRHRKQHSAEREMETSILQPQWTYFLPTTQIIKEIDSSLEPLESNSIFPTYVF